MILMLYNISYAHCKNPKVMMVNVPLLALLDYAIANRKHFADILKYIKNTRYGLTGRLPDQGRSYDLWCSSL